MSRKKLCEGKGKVLFQGPYPHTAVQVFKDTVTALDGKKRSSIKGKGRVNNGICAHIMEGLSACSFPTHFLKKLSSTEQLVRYVKMLPLEVIVRNVSAGSFSRRFGVQRGENLLRPVVEFCVKRGEEDPFIGEDVIVALEIASWEQVDEMMELALRVNDYLSGLFKAGGIILVDFKVEFGCRVDEEEEEERLVLADEITPDSCRLWESVTKKSLDKDLFRLGLGDDMLEGYEEVARRIGVLKRPLYLVRGLGKEEKKK